MEQDVSWEIMQRMPVWDDFKLLFTTDKLEERQQFVSKYRADIRVILEDNYVDAENWLSAVRDFELDKPFPNCEWLTTDFDYLFSNLFGIAVDWREYEEDLVNYFSHWLVDESLTVEIEHDNNILTINYNGIIYPVQLTESMADRYITLRHLQTVLQDKYQFRLYENSYLSDTHVFLLLPKEQWDKAENIYGKEAVDAIFRKIDQTLDFP